MEAWSLSNIWTNQRRYVSLCHTVALSSSSSMTSQVMVANKSVAQI